MNYNVFFSWVFKNEKLKKIIRKSIDSFIKGYNRELALLMPDRPKIKRTEASTGKAGTKSITEKIEKNIMESSLFVVDLSPVKDGLFAKKKCNLNATFEFGFAMGILGEDRCLAIIDKKHGDPEDLPFDFKQKTILVVDTSDEKQSCDDIVRSLKELTKNVDFVNENKRIDSLTGRNYIQKINELFYPLVQMGLENLAFINTKYIADIEAYILAFRSALNNISKQLKSDIDDLFNYFDDFNSYCSKKYFYEAKDIVKIGTYDDMATVVEKFNLMYESYKKLEFYL